jgi:hypothetical protein
MRLRTLSASRLSRSSQRQPASHGLVAQIGPLLSEVAEISLSGMTIPQQLPTGEDKVSLKLMWQNDAKVDVNRWLVVEGTVQKVTSGGSTITFDHVSYALAKMIVREAGLRLGVEPYLVK